ncbi:ion transporter [bacterium]|nr:ion transporter [bacterium]MBU1959049.1 ion transporter [bacterium]
MKNWIVKFAFFLHGSLYYKKIKETFYNFLQNSDYEYKKYFDVFMILLIVVSITILVYEVKNPVPLWLDNFDIYVVTFIFLVEYIARIWVYNNWHIQIVNAYEESKFLNNNFSLWEPTKEVLKGKIEYMLTPSAIIDLLAILPAYRPLRVLRIFVLFRVFKLLRYTKSIHQFLNVLATKKFELFTLLFLLIFIMVTAGIAIYVFEEKSNPNINSLVDALYWAMITISTVGYGDISPVTPEGRVLSMVIIIAGIAMISFVTSVIVSSFSEKLTELKENRLIEEMNKSKEFIIICGYGQMTRMFLSSYAKEYDNRYIVIEENKERVEMAVKEGYRAIHDDASRHDVIAKFNIDYAQITLLALTSSNISNVYITLNAKALSPKIKVISRATNERIAKKCRLAGADYVIMPNIIANRMLFTAITQPVMYRAFYAILTGQHLAHLDEIRIFHYQKLLNSKIEEIDFKDYKLLLIGIQAGINGEFIFNPPKTFVLQKEDVLLLMGRKVSIEHFKKVYEEVSYVT